MEKGTLVLFEYFMFLGSLWFVWIKGKTLLSMPSSFNAHGTHFIPVLTLYIPCLNQVQLQ